MILGSKLTVFKLRVENGFGHGPNSIYKTTGAILQSESFTNCCASVLSFLGFNPSKAHVRGFYGFSILLRWSVLFINALTRAIRVKLPEIGFRKEEAGVAPRPVVCKVSFWCLATVSAGMLYHKCWQPKGNGYPTRTFCVFSLNPIRSATMAYLCWLLFTLYCDSGLDNMPIF